MLTCHEGGGALHRLIDRNCVHGVAIGSKQTWPIISPDYRLVRYVQYPDILCLLR